MELLNRLHYQPICRKPGTEAATFSWFANDFQLGLMAAQYMLDDGRKVKITFSEQDGVTHVVETFDPENENPLEMQRDGWQAILNNFKAHTEG